MGKNELVSDKEILNSLNLYLPSTPNLVKVLSLV